MIIDLLQHTERYNSVYPGIEKAFHYLRTTDLQKVAPGKYELDGDNLFAIVQEYDTLSREGEKMEAHKKYIDVQYMIHGEEMVGHMILADQQPSMRYDQEKDFMLFDEEPAFYTKLQKGIFMIFFPTDLHMPSLQIGEQATVKKVVIKVKV